MKRMVEEAVLEARLDMIIQNLISTVDSVYDRRMRYYETHLQSSDGLSATSFEDQGYAGRGEGTHGIVEEGNETFPQG